MDDPLELGDEVRLAIHEWLAISTVAVFFIFLSLMSYVGHVGVDVESVSSHYLKPQFLKVFVEGAVSSPGVYEVPVGSVCSDLLARAKPQPFADLRKINLSRKLKDRQRVIVKSLPTIEVEVRGAVNPEGWVVIPKGMSIAGLVRYVVLDENADLRVFEEGRVLKNGDRVFVGSK